MSGEHIKIYPAMTSVETKDDNTVSIVSYNTLYKDWVSKERYPYIKNEEFRTWQYRLPRIRDTISKYKADIVCLQEIDIDPDTFNKDFGDYFKKELSYSHVLGPCAVIKQKKRESDGHWGNAVLYNSKRFKLVHTECLKKNSREMLLLFTDINSIQKCSKCCVNSSICCIYHSFFVINVHLPGHPNKWRSRLNAMQRILNKLKMFTYQYKTKKIEKKAVKINTNIHGNLHNIRIIICGDFNAPKTGNVDKLLLNKCIDINHYNITWNIYEEQQPKPNTQTNETKIVRLAVDSSRCAAIIGEKGARIKAIREESKAAIYIREASKGQYGLKNMKILSIKGTIDIILNAVKLIIDAVNEENILLFMERQNIELFGITKGIVDVCGVQLCVSAKPLAYCSEKTVEIVGKIGDIKCAVKMIVERLFDKECIDTGRCYDPQIELDADYKHDFSFEDCYDYGLLSVCNSDECDMYYDRIKYLPTYGDGIAVGAMDFIYFSSNNMKLIGISKTLNDDELIRKIYCGMDAIKKSNENDMDKKQQSVLFNALELPNDRLVSDHLPVCAIFGLPNICDGNNGDGSGGNKCECFVEQKVDRLRSKINRNKKRNKKRKNVNWNKNEWVWHEMNSFKL